MDRKMAVPLSQLSVLDPDESTAQAIGDWHYWVSARAVAYAIEQTSDIDIDEIIRPTAQDF
jgi:hypothetical protein